MINAQLKTSDALNKTAAAFKAMEELSTLPEFEDIFTESFIQHSDRLYEATLFLGRVVGHVQVCQVLKDE